MDTLAHETTPRRGTALKTSMRTEKIAHRDIIDEYENTPQFGARSKNLTHTVNLGTLAGCCSCPITSRITQVEDKLKTALSIIANQVQFFDLSSIPIWKR